MYAGHFGLTENPFKLVPNPSYLFLGRSHEEALAHLRYAMLQGDGFVLITGEVGTGKTTLCRAFLDQLDETVEAAYIFNPKLDSLALLKAINDEFGIDSAPDSIKELIDTLNAFLMRRSAEGGRAILLIDEAQDLSKEVLEQLRLISNLETSTRKLIQIFLVGQPELAEMLESYELRQLGQRITLSCRLDPLSRRESLAYIQHRIHVAGQGGDIPFSRSAVRVIHGYAAGVPRRINIACDRSLLTAFSQGRRHISGRMAKSAVGELFGTSLNKRAAPFFGKGTLILAVLLCSVLAATLRYYPVDRDERQEPAALTPGNGMVPPASRQDEPPSLGAEDEAMPRESTETGAAAKVSADSGISDILVELDPTESRRLSLQSAMAMWVPLPIVDPQLDAIESDREYFRVAAKQSGLSIRPIKKDFELIRSLNVPTIVGLRVPGEKKPGYMVVVGMGSGKIDLKRKPTEDAVETPLESLMPHCTRILYVVWRDFYNLIGEVPNWAPPDSIRSLKTLLAEAGFDGLGVEPVYDQGTESIVREIQRQGGIPVDGVVGTFTKILIYNRVWSLGIPYLRPGS